HQENDGAGPAAHREHRRSRHVQDRYRPHPCGAVRGTGLGPGRGAQAEPGRYRGFVARRRREAGYARQLHSGARHAGGGSGRRLHRLAIIAGASWGMTAPAQATAKAPGETGLLRALGRLGPGLITGASDDDPSGIGTYSQVGARFGYGMAWIMLFSYPLM